MTDFASASLPLGVSHPVRSYPQPAFALDPAYAAMSFENGALPPAGVPVLGGPATLPQFTAQEMAPVFAPGGYPPGLLPPQAAFSGPVMTPQALPPQALQPAPSGAVMMPQEQINSDLVARNKAILGDITDRLKYTEAVTEPIKYNPSALLIGMGFSFLFGFQKMPDNRMNARQMEQALNELPEEAKQFFDLQSSEDIAEVITAAQHLGRSGAPTVEALEAALFIREDPLKVYDYIAGNRNGVETVVNNITGEFEIAADRLDRKDLSRALKVLGYEDKTAKRMEQNFFDHFVEQDWGIVSKDEFISFLEIASDPMKAFDFIDAGAVNGNNVEIQSDPQTGEMIFGHTVVVNEETGETAFQPTERDGLLNRGELIKVLELYGLHPQESRSVVKDFFNNTEETEYGLINQQEFIELMRRIEGIE